MTGARSDALEGRIRADQLEDLKAGLPVSMPISSILSVLILAGQWIAGHGLLATMWFLIVTAINGVRLILAFYDPQPDGTGWNRRLCDPKQQLHLFSALALISGVVWSFIVVLTDGYTIPQSPLHLIILTGICAGAVTYATSYAAVAICFITPPLLATSAAVAIRGSIEDYLLAFAVLLFLAGLVRGALLGQARFRETSRLRHEAERTAGEMERLSRKDVLTDLLNRRGLEEAIDRLREADGPFVTMLIDLDGFKSVNDTYGHKAGDDVLSSIAGRIKDEVPPGGTLARIGGDEFLLVYPVSAGRLSPSDRATNIIAKIARPFPSFASVQVGACIGIYLSKRAKVTEMLLRADVALYAAKHHGRNEFRQFDDELEDVIQRRQHIERDLRCAIDTGKIELWFQPVVRLDTSEIIGFEALLRWFHSSHGPIAPPEIIEIAREIGMMDALTDTVFRSCCDLMARLTEAGHGNCRVAMNVSPRELENGRLDDLILDGLERRGLPASMFEIEITEEAPVDGDRVDEQLARIAHAGISIALDDFGTGFSTLASLKDRRINKVKIDQGFVRGLAQSPDDQLLVKAVMDIGKGLGIEITAEGVEAEADRHLLQELGCRAAQGYLFSKAVPMDKALELLMKEHVGPR
ncbi:hypothetical protein GCM10007276_08910 [Agaricicola taiwanensis]|uniref:EAL domain-containing protein n=1 Tax=Agaricicola taiwanensis TaxID=591372 RepID=A0A8J2YG60_9RHOB|nr:bifunctional diguanylate cyclase/phosphodiesterase [Agaricicola taiwanensis]GGE33787.1 hypothetical protein GCM10007276_08910 [Agaricicola taiwanensis]